jgi:replication factor C subunit 1
LKDKTFVITGVLDSLWRNEAEDLVKRHSGRVTSAVSGKTTFLVAGTQAGKSKMKAVSPNFRSSLV